MSTPLCQYFGNCGGCSLQHIDYEVQLENKKKLVSRLINFEDVKVFSDKAYQYRNRMDLIFHKGGIGFRKRENWKEIVDIETCVIANEKLNQLIKEVREFSKNIDYFDIKRNIGTFKYAVIRTPSNDSSISFVMNEDSTKLSDATEKIESFAKKTSAKNVIATYVNKLTNESISSEFYAIKGSDMLKETLLGKEFDYSVQGFFQNNTVMAEIMQKYVNTLLKNYDTKNSHLLDLYGGVGTFGIINSDLFKSTTIIESVKECIDAANENIKNNNTENTEAIVLDAAQLKKMSFDTPLYVINDPPRSGMNIKTIEELNKINPKVIIYISCNVEQLSKELPKFKEYHIKSAAIFDLFPQTNHVETVVELIRKNL